MSFTARRLDEGKSKRSLPWKDVFSTAIKLSGPALKLYQLWQKRHEEKVRQRKRIILLKRTLLVLVAILVSLLLLIGIAKGLLSINILTFDSVVRVAGVPPPVDEQGHTNILLLGQGDRDHDGKDLTDSIIIASIDPQNTKSAVLISLPRDLYFLKTEKMGKGRINSFYRDYKGYLRFQEGMEAEAASMEAIQELAKEIGRKLHIDIHHTVKIDFIGFVEAVDALGGVDIDVPHAIVDTEYPDENYGFQTFEVQAGLQRMDGETALKYARSRHTTSDFDRSARQQQLLAALSQQARESGIASDPMKIAELVRILSNNVKTTMTIKELIGLADAAQDLDRSKIITMQLNDRNGLYGSTIEPGGLLYTPPRDLFNGASVLLPVSIPEFPITWKQIQALTQLITQHQEVYLERANISVLNAGAPSGTARKLANELEAFGFSITNIDNASIGKQETSFIIANGQYAATASLLGEFFNIAPTDAPIGLTQDEVAHCTIVLGKDFTFAHMQDLLSPQEQ